MTVHDLIDAIESFAPPSYAESWDRVGLHVGRLDKAIEGPVMLAIDLTEAVLAEAIESKASAIVAYHPPIWNPVDRLTDQSSKGRILLGAVEHGIAVYSPHTALDAAPGGVTDWLCEGICGGPNAGDSRALVSHTGRERVKVVTFVPHDAADRVREAMASAGAGIIGAYRLCSFGSEGTGTFFAEDEANPSVGERGVLERVPETRLEMIASRSALPLIVATLREFHPYEEPPIDLYPLQGVPERQVGAGRRLVLDRPATCEEIGTRLKAHLDRSRLRFALPFEATRPIQRIGVVPGAGESMVGVARDEGCELFVTGEMRHHAIAEALEMGVGVLLAGHTNTERGFLPRLGVMLDERGFRTILAAGDDDLLRTM